MYGHPDRHPDQKIGPHVYLGLIKIPSEMELAPQHKGPGLIWIYIKLRIYLSYSIYTNRSIWLWEHLLWKNRWMTETCHSYDSNYGNPPDYLHWLSCRCLSSYPWGKEGGFQKIEKRGAFFILFFRENLACWCPGSFWPSSAWSLMWSKSLETWPMPNMPPGCLASSFSPLAVTSSLSSGLTGICTLRMIKTKKKIDQITLIPRKFFWKSFFQEAASGECWRSCSWQGLKLPKICSFEIYENMRQGLKPP